MAVSVLGEEICAGPGQPFGSLLALVLFLGYLPVPRMRFLSPSLVPFRYLLGVCALMCATAPAQELRHQPVPFSVWLDLDALTSLHPPTPDLPIWLESVQVEHPRPKPEAEPSTLFRLWFRRGTDLHHEVEVRLFFEDLPGVSPRVTGWTETGALRYDSGFVGNALGLSNSETLLISTADLDYLEITVPGDGQTLHGLFLSSLKLSQLRFALDFPTSGALLDPFGATATTTPKPEFDTFLFGRVKALIEPGPLKVSYAQPISWDLQLASAPLLAVLSFEILNADLTYLPEVALNDRALGSVTPQLPDLADPAYRGESIPGEPDQRFRYTGWLRVQKILPGSALRAGSNEVDLVVARQTQAVAIRGVEVQLKYPMEESHSSAR